MGSSQKTTALEEARHWVERFPSIAAAARQILIDGRPMSDSHLRVWLWDPNRRFDPRTAQPVALAMDLPLEAVLFKNTPLCDLPCEKARKAGAS